MQNIFLNKTLRCPYCKFPLKFNSNNIKCFNCRSKFSYSKRIPILFNKKSLDNDLILTMKKWNEEYKKLSQKDLQKEKTRYDQFDLIETEREIKRFILPGHKIFLELGCGPAFLSLAMAKKGYTVIGIDISIEALKIARNIFKKENVKGYFICANITNLPLKNNYIDFINGSGVIEHFKDTEKAVAELFRILKPNGIALNTVPYLSFSTIYRQLWGNIPDLPILKHLAEFFHIKLLKGKHMIYGYEKSFSAKKIKKLFSQAGFSDIKIGLFDCFLPLSFVKNKNLKLILRKLTQFRPFWPMIYIYAKNGFKNNKKNNRH